MVALVITTRDALTGLPLIEHRFFGADQAGAWARYQTHLGADAFLRACGAYDGFTHEYDGTTCVSSWRWENA